MDVQTPSPQIAISTALDEHWYERFTGIYFEDHECFRGDTQVRNYQKREFLAGRIENPSLDYFNLERVSFTAKAKALRALENDIVLRERNGTVRDAYVWKIDEMLLKTAMLEAAKFGEDKRFLEFSELIYGAPDEQIFAYTMGHLKKRLIETEAGEDAESKAAARELLGLVHMERVPPADPALAFPQPNALLETGEPISAAETKRLFEEALQEFGIANWRVVIDEDGGRSALGTVQEKRELLIPNDENLQARRDPFRLLDVQALAAHEVGVHVRRRENGEKSPLKLLGIGLDRYLKGEEGLASYEQQRIEGDNDYAGFLGYLAVSLAYGLDGEKRDFRRLFDILRAYFIMTLAPTEDRRQRADTLAWNRVVRTFRGTTGRTPGAVFTKDIVYREGNIGIWKLVREESPEVKRFFVGKYDPTNERHTHILDELGISGE